MEIIKSDEIYSCNTLIVGSGCAAYNAADSLYEEGEKDILMVSEGVNMGTSRNTGSDKQTYYKLSQAGGNPDSVYAMANTLYKGESVNGDTALVEAALSLRCFYKLIEKGVPFPHDAYGQYVGYQTDHDTTSRATSCGPLTSKYMTECLERSVQNKNIEMLDGVRIVEVLKRKKDRTDEIYGAIGLRVDDSGLHVISFNCKNIIYATGGPSGIYHNSVYPFGHTGSHGPLIEAGVKFSNVTEWQYGIASTDFRWNLSGSYQQVIPRYVSQNPDGSDEKEFLEDYFNDTSDMLTAIFLKGYQWPFDPKKMQNSGSSMVDFAIFCEEKIKGRKVYMDFMNNPSAAIKDGEFDFSLLKKEAYEYLKNSDILFGKPIDRLKKFNLPAYNLYKDNNQDIAVKKLSISVCSQNNNGGATIDSWWQSSLNNLFVVGEAAGNFGVYRPGGSALNATQVSSLRAAQYIGAKSTGAPLNEEEFKTLSNKNVASVVSKCEKLLEGGNELPIKLRHKYQKGMDSCASYIRNKDEIKQLIKVVEQDKKNLFDETKAQSPNDVVQAWINADILSTQYLYLKSFLNYIEEGGKSRGSYLVLSDSIDLSKVKDGIDIELDNGERKEIIQVSQLMNDDVTIENVVRRPIPDTDLWFENIYNKFSENKIIGE